MIVSLTDRNLQLGLQAVLLSQFAPARLTPDVSGAGKSRLATNAAMVGGAALALQKLNQIEENTGDVSEGLGFY